MRSTLVAPRLDDLPVLRSPPIVAGPAVHGSAPTRKAITTLLRRRRRPPPAGGKISKIQDTRS